VVVISKNAAVQTVEEKHPKDLEDSQVLLQEYQATIERFKQDNEELHRRV